MTRLVAFILLVLTFPIYPIVFLLIKCTSPGPFIFKQKRAGKNSIPFTMYKFRTMVHNAEKFKSKYTNLNEASGPAFKIRNDPRFTQIGRFIAHAGIDEIPQLINIIKGEMAFVGPRPLPLDESIKVPKKYKLRFSIKPGVTSPWIVRGHHKLSYKERMELDTKYALSKNIWYDSVIILRTVFLLLTADL